MLNWIPVSAEGGLSLLMDLDIHYEVDSDFTEALAGVQSNIITFIYKAPYKQLLTKCFDRQNKDEKLKVT